MPPTPRPCRLLAANSNVLRLAVATAILYFCSMNVYLSSQLALLTKVSTSSNNKHRSHFHPHPAMSMGNRPSFLVENKEEQRRRRKKVCVAVGVLSRGREHQLRQWHRQQFRHWRKATARTNNSTAFHMELHFPIAYAANHSSAVLDEAEEHGDVWLLPHQEGYRRLMVNTLAFLRHAVKATPFDGECTSRYIIKADSDVLIQYGNLQTALTSSDTKTESLYFGLMLTEFPTESRVVRAWSETSHSRLPPWAVGPFYGMTVDVAEAILRVQSTVVFPDGDMVPEEDRGIGIALQRGGVQVQHIMLLRELYLFCDVTYMGCEELTEAVAVHVGYGISGADKNRIGRKQDLLRALSARLGRCHGDAGSHKTKGSYFVPLDEMPPTEESLLFGCTGPQETAEALVKEVQVDKKRIAADFDLTAVNKCAEEVYRRNYPDAFSSFSSLTGREHFLAHGYNEGYAYFCPRDTCLPNLDAPACSGCDPEAKYLQSYPDIANAVESGSIPSGKWHFDHYGKVEGRIWNCHARYQEPGTGTTEGCLDTYGRFVNLTRPIVETWPIYGLNTNSKYTNKAVVFVEGREHPWSDYTLRVARRYTGHDWMFYLIGPPALCRFWRKKYNGPMVRIIALPQEFGDLSDYPDQINRLYKSKFLWENVLQSEHVLFMQSDALLLRHGIEDFFDYDFVGSPIFPESFPAKSWWYLCVKHQNCGGNGGLSLRRRSAMLDALRRCETKDLPFNESEVDEDVWFSSCMLELDKKTPHPVSANRFSVGSTCNVDAPLGFHKLWQNCRESTCVEALMSSHLFDDIYGSSFQAERNCREGNLYYLLTNDDVRSSGISDGWGHYTQYGKGEGRKWYCFDEPDLTNRIESNPFGDIPHAWLKSSQ